MKDYYAPDSYYEQDCCERYDCRECREKEQDIENAADFCKAIMEQLYSKEKLDEELLEFRLGELCAYLGVKIKVSPFNDIQIQRKPEPKPVYLNDWFEYNKQQLNQLIAK